ncbi:hypothetical protein IWW55_004049 [Coemansia sp. RSA 2706]|nr:hypothetical protein LPJ63_000368 [Coemansia sp. RSA 2711]KAJ2299935.1 hypothetical protein IWW55_004049 [Coemansia sp. RSA 2706]KAJ2307925.1 hypothetical protein IWW54_004232 [Coemansia sp. RSA 2705]KAJ2315829.1 hypothetical protein IWW52_003962 [Coemansia sp. RSA 2704]KAJ2363365.1 hypothetical protein H4S01_004338 [Coemansia sp. RSA 2610]
MSSGGLETIHELAERARASDVQMSESICLNLSHFKAVLRQLRKVDDNIILRMNTTNTAEPSECRALFGVLQAAYRRRDHDVRYCLDVLDGKLAERQQHSLQVQREWVESELGVESIVKRRSLAVFRARCPFFELPEEYADILEQKRTK